MNKCLFSRDIERLMLTKVNIDVFVNEAHVNGKLWPPRWDQEIGHFIDFSF